MEENTPIVIYDNNINIDKIEYIIEINKNIELGVSGVHKTHLIEIYLYNSDRSQYGLLSFSIYENNIWINKVKCGIILLKGKCAKILFSIFYLYITSILAIIENINVELIVMPDINYKAINEIMEAIRDIKEPYKQTTMVQLFEAKICEISQEDKNKTLYDLVLKYLYIPATEKLRTLYQSLGFKIIDETRTRMITTVGELKEALGELKETVGKFRAVGELKETVVIGGLLSKKSVLRKKLYKQKIYSKKILEKKKRKKLYKQKIYSKKILKKKKRKKLLSKKIWSIKNKSRNMKIND
jgi:hypothetical protein